VDKPSAAQEAARLVVLADHGLASIGLDYEDPDLDLAVKLAQDVTGAQNAAVHIIQADRQVSLATAGASRRTLDRVDSMCATMMWHPDAVFVTSSAQDHPLLADNPHVSGPDPSVRFYAVAPLVGRDGLPLGTLCAWSPTPDRLDAVQTRALERLAAFVTRVLEIRRDSRRFEHHAMHDSLTGLPNRRMFTALAAEALQGDPIEGRRALALVLDIDHFKVINDRYGHATGDEVLTAIGSRIMAVLPAPALCARWGGDEFVALVPADAESSADQIVSMLTTALSVPVATRNAGLVAIGVSVGTRRIQPGDTIDGFLSAADADMYRRRTARRVAALTGVATLGLAVDLEAVTGR
jgi:diguanylate cyclase (GGDEF)-like protein